MISHCRALILGVTGLEAGRGMEIRDDVDNSGVCAVLCLMYALLVVVEACLHLTRLDNGAASGYTTVADLARISIPIVHAAEALEYCTRKWSKCGCGNIKT